MKSVHVQYRKWPNRPHHEFTAQRLGEDGTGVWLARHPGPSLRSGAVRREAGRLGLLLIPPTVWWSAMWIPTGDGEEVTVDVATPAVWENDHVWMVDLDLDVVRHPDGRVEILDQEEFEQQRALLGYSDELVENARETALSVARALERRIEPFDGAATPWLARLLQ